MWPKYSKHHPPRYSNEKPEYDSSSSSLSHSLLLVPKHSLSPTSLTYFIASPFRTWTIILVA